MFVCNEYFENWGICKTTGLSLNQKACPFIIKVIYCLILKGGYLQLSSTGLMEKCWGCKVMFVTSMWLISSHFHMTGFLFKFSSAFFLLKYLQFRDWAVSSRIYYESRKVETDKTLCFRMFKIWWILRCIYCFFIGSGRHIIEKSCISINE